MVKLIKMEMVLLAYFGIKFVYSHTFSIANFIYSDDQPCLNGAVICLIIRHL